jgi:hypothetical protein
MKEAVIFGNGKSFNLRADLDFMDTFGCNYIGISGTYPRNYVCIDERVLRTTPGDIKREIAACVRFYTSGLVEHEYRDHPKAILSDVFLPKWPGENEKKVFGGTAVYVALKAAYVQGFERVYLLGVDHEPAWDHFDPTYPRALSPDRVGMIEHFKIAGYMYRAAGREIFNLSAPSAVDKVFPRLPRWDIDHRDVTFFAPQG